MTNYLIYNTETEAQAKIDGIYEYLSGVYLYANCDAYMNEPFVKEGGLKFAVVIEDNALSALTADEKASLTTEPNSWTWENTMTDLGE